MWLIRKSDFGKSLLGCFGLQPSSTINARVGYFPEEGCQRANRNGENRDFLQCEFILSQISTIHSLHIFIIVITGGY